MFDSIVVGIGVDYGVYWLYRFEEELAGAPTVVAAVRRTAERGGAALLLRALTAMGAFIVLTLTDFRASGSSGSCRAWPSCWHSSR
jgi:predicted RND superfamily exporter protein